MVAVNNSDHVADWKFTSRDVGVVVEEVTQQLYGWQRMAGKFGSIANRFLFGWFSCVYLLPLNFDSLFLYKILRHLNLVLYLR